MKGSSVLAALGIALLACSALAATVAPLAVVVVDTRPPSITFVSPENNSTVYVGDTVTIRVKFEDAGFEYAGSGLDDVYVRVWDDGNNVASYVKENLGGVSSHEAVLTWTPSSEGTYRIAAVAYDLAQNMAPLKAIYVRAGKAPTCILRISVNNPSWGTTRPDPGRHEYVQGRQVPVTAEPSEGYRFVGWSGDASGASASITITMDRDKSITANFEEKPQTYTLSVSVSPAGSGTVVDEKGRTVTTMTVEAGTSLLLTAKPGAGYEFLYWSGDASSTSATVQVTVTKDTYVTANFREVQAPAGTFLLNGQTVSASSTVRLATTSLDFRFVPTQSAEYITGVTVTIDGARIPMTKSGEQWVGSHTLPGEGTYRMSVSLTWARGEVPVCSLSLSYQRHEENNPPGKVNVSVSVSPANSGSVVGKYGMLDKGTLVELQAFPNEGYRFVRWVGDASGTDPKLVFVADRDMDVQAVFEPVPEEQWKQEAKTFTARYLPLGLAVLGAISLGLSFFLRAKGR